MARRGLDLKPGEYMVAGNGVAWRLIESKTAHNAPRLDFTTGIDASHDLLMAVLTNIVPAADVDNFGVRMKSGGAFKSGANDYSYGNVRLFTPFEGNISYSYSSIWLGSTSIGNLAPAGTDGIVYIAGHHAPDRYCTVWWGPATERAVDDGDRGVIFSDHYNTAATVDGFRFLMNSGDIADGTIALYGLAK